MNQPDGNRSSIYASTPVEHAVKQVQFALRDLKDVPEVVQAGIRFTSADIELVTTTSIDANGEVKVLVVTVGGALGLQSTSTIKVTLAEPEIGKIAGISANEIPGPSITALVKQLAGAVLLGQKPPYPLSFSSGAATVQLVVDANGYIEVANDDIVSKILKFFGVLEYSFKITGELIRTSSITLHYDNGQS